MARRRKSKTKKNTSTLVPGWLKEVRGSARRSLAELRTGRGHTGMIRAFYFCIERGWYDSEMIGTTSEEIHKLHKALRLRMALEDVARLRRGEIGAVPLFRIRAAQEIGVTLEEAGITEQELQSLIAGNTPRLCVDCPLVTH
jgi:hypothetical protein